MTTMTQEDYRKLLIQLADTFQRDASSVEEQTCCSTGGQADGGLSNTPMHLGDMGTDASLQETSSVLLENEQYLLREVVAAIKRLENGTFGRCEVCDQQIAEDRLEAIPYARKCFHCADQQEHQSQSNIAADRPFVESQMMIGDDETRSARKRTGSRKSLAYTDFDSDLRSHVDEADIHAAGTAGGGTALGGLAGTNFGRGDPNGSDLERATGSGEFDVEDRSNFDRREVDDR